MRFFPSTALLIAATFLAACLPVSSKVPVGSTLGFKPDRSLMGTWKATGPDGGEPSFVHILGNDDGTMTALIVTPPQKENLGEWSAYSLRAAMVGANHIVNAQERSANGKSSQGPLTELHVLLLYRATGAKQLTLYQMDDKAVAAAIRAGEVAGEVDPGDNGDVRITAPEPALDAFMKTPRAAKLFVKPLVVLNRAD